MPRQQPCSSPLEYRCWSACIVAGISARDLYGQEPDDNWSRPSIANVSEINGLSNAIVINCGSRAGGDARPGRMTISERIVFDWPRCRGIRRADKRENSDCHV